MMSKFYCMNPSTVFCILMVNKHKSAVVCALLGQGTSAKNDVTDEGGEQRHQRSCNIYLWDEESIRILCCYNYVCFLNV